MTKSSSRYAWAAAILDPRPGEKILEIGPGSGQMIELVLPLLSRGSYTGIERSDAMCATVSRRFPEAIAVEMLKLQNSEFPANSLPPESFDKIFIFNLNVFWMDPCDELCEIAHLLSRDGRFFIFHRPPPGHGLDEFAEAFRSNLQKYGFEIEQEILETRDEINSLAIVSKPIRR